MTDTPLERASRRAPATVFLALALGGCVVEADVSKNQPIQECTNIYTGELMIIDPAKVIQAGRGIGTQGFLKFTDQNGFVRTVTNEDEPNWKCKPQEQH